MRRIRDAAVRMAVNTAVRLACRDQVRLFRQWVGYDPDIALPLKYHEKMFWRKLFDRDPDHVLFCDKLATKQFFAAIVPEIRVPKTHWSGDAIEDAPRELLAGPVVVKANHGSNYNYFWKGPDDDFGKLSVLTKKWMGENYGSRYSEWGYYGVRRQLFIEELISAERPDGLIEINIRCVGGQAILGSLVLHNKTEKMQACYVGTDGRRPEWDDAPHSIARMPRDYKVPDCYQHAIEAGKKLSVGRDYLRVDFMSDGRELYAGEITVYPGAGLSPASPDGVPCGETFIAANWDLRKSWLLTSPQKGWKKYYASWLRSVQES